jgi:hypothetical protein
MCDNFILNYDKTKCKNKLCFFASQTSIWFKKLHYIILFTINNNCTQKM